MIFEPEPLKDIKVQSDLDLLMHVLSGCGIKKSNLRSTAREVFHAFNQVDSKLYDLSPRLQEIKGIGLARSLLLEAAFEFTKRRLVPDSYEVHFPSDVIPLITHYALEKQEHFLCISLDGANHVIKIHLVSKGLINRVHAHPREVFVCAIKDLASSIIVAHNHPSKILRPTKYDINVTRQLKMAGEIIGIQLKDHLIINTSGYYSFKEDNEL